jgi:hypothetical protein
MEAKPYFSGMRALLTMPVPGYTEQDTNRVPKAVRISVRMHASDPRGITTLGCKIYFIARKVVAAYCQSVWRI